MTVENMPTISADSASPVAFTPPGEGETYFVVGDLVTLKATSAQTNGAFTMIETTVVPNAGPPPHIHTREDEWFTILEGELHFMVGDKTIIATPGACLCCPRNIPHAFKNVSAKPARMIVTITPGGIETFFAEAGVPILSLTDIPASVTGEHIGKLLAAAPKQGIQILLPAP